MSTYLFAFFIGVVMGLLGGGGSIMTVPVLVYGMGLDPKKAVASALGIVGLTALIGITSYARARLIAWDLAWRFIPGAMVGTWIGTRVAKHISGELQLLLFSIVMITAAIFMLRKKPAPTQEKKAFTAWFYLSSLLIGVLTGIVGVGGGFLIVPSLMMASNLPITQAVGTSLLIIALNSLWGFSTYAWVMPMDWKFLFTFSFFSTAGVLVGGRVIQYLPQKFLQKIFAVFLLVTGGWIIFTR